MSCGIGSRAPSMTSWSSVSKKKIFGGDAFVDTVDANVTTANKAHMLSRWFIVTNANGEVTLKARLCKGVASMLLLNG